MLPGLRGLPERLERMVPMAQQAHKDRLALLELMVLTELLVCRVFKGLLDPQVHRVLMGRMVLPVLRGLQVPMVLTAPTEPPVLKALKGLLEQQGRMALTALMVLLALPGLLV